MDSLAAGHPQSFAADLKEPADAAKVRELITKADIVMHNFCPGVMERKGFDYESEHRTVFTKPRTAIWPLPWGRFHSWVRYCDARN